MLYETSLQSHTAWRVFGVMLPVAYRALDPKPQPGMGGWELKSKDLRPGSRAILSQRMATIRRGTSVRLTNPKPHRNDRSHDHADDLSMNQDPSKQGTTAKPERCRPCQDPFPCAENYTRRTRGAHRAIENFLARKHFASVPPLRSAKHTRVFGG